MKPDTFEKMKLSSATIKALRDMGFKKPTPIQAHTIELLMGGEDITAMSRTGTGKTAAFGIPAIEMTNPDDPSLQVLILAPTRELAMQICGEIRKMLKYTEDIKVAALYGGQPIIKQIAALRKGVQIAVGTPGRIMDHLKRHTLKTGNLRLVVLDEADEMLDMGFREDIEAILKKTPADRQTALFSATMAEEIRELAKKYQSNPHFIKAEHKELTVPEISQTCFEVKEATKPRAAARLLEMYRPDLALVFCNTKKRADALAETLRAMGFSSEALHGDLNQTQRDDVMGKFRSGKIKILVSTDIAARGIDVADVAMVINYDLPLEAEYYVHRIGRTGRAGKEGMAFSLVCGREMNRLKEIAEYAGCKINLKPLPSLSDIGRYRQKELADRIFAIVREGNLTPYADIAQGLAKKGLKIQDIAAALIKMSLADEEAPVFVPGNPDDMIRLEINAGSRKAIRAKDIVGAVAGECSIPGSVLGHIEIETERSIIEVPCRYVPDILKLMQGKKIKKAQVKVKPLQKNKL